MIYARNYNCRKEHYLNKYKNAFFINPNDSEDIYKPDKADLKQGIDVLLQQSYGITPLFFSVGEELVIDYTTNVLKSQEEVMVKNGNLKNDLDYYIKYDYIYKKGNTITLFYIIWKSIKTISDYATRNILIPKMLYSQSIAKNNFADAVIIDKVISLEFDDEYNTHFWKISQIDINDFKSSDRDKFLPLFYTDDEEPQCDYSRKCKKCGYRDYCNVPKFSVADLESTPNCWRVLDPIIKNHKDLKLENLTEQEINSLKDYQKFKYFAYLSQQNGGDGKYINKAIILTFLNKIFQKGYVSFDFETYSTIIPIDNKYAPYAQIPFSYSLDLVNEKNELIKHSIYITDYKSENFDELIIHLVDELPTDLPIVVYFKTFEIGRFKELKELYPQLASTIDKWIDNVMDLYEVFEKGGYYDINFGKSLSLKSIYPVLCGNKYQTLEINKGDRASLDYKMIFNNKNYKDADKIMKDLTEYNSQDTMAQIEIIEQLKKNI